MSSHSEAAGPTPAPRPPVPGTLTTSSLSTIAQSTIVQSPTAQSTIVQTSAPTASAPDDPVAYWWPVCGGEEILRAFHAAPEAEAWSVVQRHPALLLPELVD